MSMSRQYRPRVSDTELLQGIIDTIYEKGSAIASELSGLCGDQKRITRMLRDLRNKGILCAEYRKRPSGRMALTYFFPPRGELLALTNKLQRELLREREGEIDIEEGSVREIFENMRRCFEVMYEGDDEKE